MNKKILIFSVKGDGGYVYIELYKFAFNIYVDQIFVLTKSNQYVRLKSPLEISRELAG